MSKPPRKRKKKTHVHDGYAGSMQLFDCLLWRHTNSTDEKRGFLLNDDIYELVQFAILVIILQGIPSQCHGVWEIDMWCHAHVCFPGIPADLWDEEVNPKWCIWILQVLLDSLNLMRSCLVIM